MFLCHAIKKESLILLIYITFTKERRSIVYSSFFCVIIRIFKNRGIIIMKLTITRIEKRIVTCELEDGTRIDIDRRWFADDLEEGDNIEFDVIDCKNIDNL